MNNMENKKNYSREIVTSMLGIMILILLLFSTSYAVFVESIDGSKINSLTTGYLSLNYTNSDSNIVTLANSLPISDEVGKYDITSGKLFEFSVSNDFMKNINYKIIIEEIVSEVDIEYLKIYLTDDNNNILGQLNDDVNVLSSFETTDLVNERVIYNGVLIGKDDVKKFKLKVWVSDDYLKVSDKPVTFSFKVSVEGTI